jgi:hypothetical protein
VAKQNCISGLVEIFSHRRILYQKEKQRRKGKRRENKRGSLGYWIVLSIASLNLRSFLLTQTCPFSTLDLP